jgi:transposase-like protein
MFAGEIRRKRVQHMHQLNHWRWHLDQVYVKINGEMRYLWRAIDHEGEVLGSIFTRTRDNAAPLKFIKKPMKRHGRPKVIVTDGLRSYARWTERDLVSGHQRSAAYNAAQIVRTDDRNRQIEISSHHPLQRRGHPQMTAPLPAIGGNPYLGGTRGWPASTLLQPL